jgi:hypothetical protein
MQYGDLPVFDSIRSLGGHQEDTAPRLPAAEVLVLCPFDKDFDDVCWPEIQRGIQAKFSPNSNDDGPARRVVDLATPELLSRRLYESIRLDLECVADITNSRANVYFELGVRLAAHELGATIIRCIDFPKSTKLHDTDLIDAMFGCGQYSRDGAKDPNIANALSGSQQTGTGGEFSHGFVFRLSQECFETDQEITHKGLQQFLWNAIISVGGADRQTQAKLPILYGDNLGVRDQASRFVFEGLLAFVLLKRYNSTNYREDQRWSIALVDLKNVLQEIDCSTQELTRLTALIRRIEDENEY